MEKSMFNTENKIMIGNIDCTNYKEKFKIWSITRYRDLEKKLTSKGYKLESFDELEKYFINDIRLRREISKYIFYIENKLGAEIVNFLLLEKEFLTEIANKKSNEFIQINKNNPSKKINKMNEILNKNGKIKISPSCPDKLSFGGKILLAEVLKYYCRLKKHDGTIELSTSLKELREFKKYRNMVVHHEFIFIDNDLIAMLKKLEKHITTKYKAKFLSFLKNLEKSIVL